MAESSTDFDFETFDFETFYKYVSNLNDESYSADYLGKTEFNVWAEKVDQWIVHRSELDYDNMGQEDLYKIRDTLTHVVMKIINKEQ